jgi:hypothetical protein
VVRAKVADLSCRKSIAFELGKKRTIRHKGVRPCAGSPTRPLNPAARLALRWGPLAVCWPPIDPRTPQSSAQDASFALATSGS